MNNWQVTQPWTNISMWSCECWTVLYCILFITSAEGEGYVFISVGLFVCLFVCFLFVCSQHYGQTRERISWNFQDWWDLVHEMIRNILEMFHLTPWTREFFPIFSEDPVPVTNNTEKRLNGFSWNFQETLHIRKETIRHHDKQYGKVDKWIFMKYSR